MLKNSTGDCREIAVRFIIVIIFTIIFTIIIIINLLLKMMNLMWHKLQLQGDVARCYTDEPKSSE